MGRSSFEKRIQHLDDEVYEKLSPTFKQKKNDFTNIKRTIKKLEKKKLKLKNDWKNVDDEVRILGKEFTKLYNELKQLDEDYNPSMNVVFQKRRKVSTKRLSPNDEHNIIRTFKDNEYNESFQIKIRCGKFDKSLHLSTKKNVFEKLSKYNDKINDRTKMDNVKYHIIELIRPIIMDNVDFRDYENWNSNWNLNFDKIVEELDKRNKIKNEEKNNSWF